MVVGDMIGVYRVVAKLGEGGMGEVYRAHDTKLDREVAIKVLPAAFAQDPERVARFSREARMLAALNHPNIAAIYGVEEGPAEAGPHVPALILELVEGPTLADVLAGRSEDRPLHSEDRRGRPSGRPLSLDEALPIARQIADALEAAHEQGIIHRDLKPANIKVRDDGTVKVLDFGLAKALGPPGAGRDVRRAGSPDPAYGATHSPTLSLAATQAGMILGTAAYMAPEQAKGREADKRSDIWAFGCVLYEMLTGRRAFDGEDMADTLAFVLSREPDWTALPATTPESMPRLLRRCLEKDRRRRLADIADARPDLDEASGLAQVEHTRRSEGDAPMRRFQRERMAWAAGVCILGLVAATALVVGFRTPPGRPELRVGIALPARANPGSLALSPDGGWIAFVAPGDEGTSVWVQSLDGRPPRPLTRTTGALGERVFWSPDSRSLGFTAEGKLKRVDVETGVVQTLADAPQPGGLGGAWNRDGVILFAPTPGPLFRVTQNGEQLAAVTRVEGPHIRHTVPQFLPDGRHFLFFSSGDPALRGVYIADLDGTTAPRRILDDQHGAVYASSGHMFFSRQGALLAQRFDADRMTFVGEPWQVADRVWTDDVRGQFGLSASDVGSLVYYGVDEDAQPIQRRLTWFDRSGKELQRLDDRDPVDANSLSLSPSGDRLAITSRGSIWLLDASREGRRTRVASELATFPLWSPKGDRLIFQSRVTGVGNLHQRALTGDTDERLLETPGTKFPNDWSPDGGLLLYRDQDAATGFDLWVLPVEGEGQTGRLRLASGRNATPVVNTPAAEMNGQFSPDGRWIAYESDESGRWEIYVQPFERPGERIPISLGGGRYARWRRDGTELYFYAPEGWLMAVPIRPAPAGGLAAGDPARLFRVLLESGAGPPQYLVSDDGRRFLANAVTDISPPVVTMIVNWTPPR